MDFSLALLSLFLYIQHCAARVYISDETREPPRQLQPSLPRGGATTHMRTSCPESERERSECHLEAIPVCSIFRSTLSLILFLLCAQPYPHTSLGTLLALYTVTPLRSLFFTPSAFFPRTRARARIADARVYMRVSYGSFLFFFLYFSLCFWLRGISECRLVDPGEGCFRMSLRKLADGFFCGPASMCDRRSSSHGLNDILFRASSCGQSLIIVDWALCSIEFFYRAMTVHLRMLPAGLAKLRSRTTVTLCKKVL